MDDTAALTVFDALSQPTRLSTFRRLVAALPDGVPAGTLARLGAVPQNTMSAHLAVLSRAGLVSARRDGRSILYRAELARLGLLLRFLVDDCCGGRIDACFPAPDRPKEAHPMSDRVFNVLFLCTGNTARSILSEAILARDGQGAFRAFSAGSFPKGQVNPFALETLAAHGYPTEGFRSKSWTEFSGPDAPHMDFIFTVCDSAAGEACPVWPGHPATAHWGIEDPAAVEGTDMDKRRAFETAFRYMRNRISAFIALPLEKLDAIAMADRLRAIGHMDGASAGAA